MRSISLKIVSGRCLGRGPLSSAKKRRTRDPLKPSREGSRLDDAQFSLFHSGPKKSPKWWPKAVEIEGRSSENALQRGSQKSI